MQINKSANRPPWAIKLRARREDLGLTQEQIVAESGDMLSQRLISYLERGTSPLAGMGLAKAAAYARALKWTLPELEAATGINLGLGALSPPLMWEPTVEAPPKFIVVDVEPLEALAGSPTSFSEPSELGKIIMPEQDYKPNIKILRARGDSMLQPDGKGIADRDFLKVDINDLMPRDGKVYVVQDESGAVVVKRVRDWSGQLWLTSDNPKYPPFRLEEARVLGRVVRVEGDKDF